MSAMSPISFCVYGSSSTKTKDKYIDASFELGAEIAKRGHVCVNGGGCNGCMGAMNRGCRSEKGSVIGVIHQVRDTSRTSSVCYLSLHTCL